MKLLLLILLLAPKIATVSHQATLYYQNTACTSHNPCVLQVWRAVCPTATTCPNYQEGSSLWIRVSSGAGSATPTPTGTTWVFKDTDPILQDNTTYAYCATNSFYSSTNNLSGCSVVWSGTTSGGSNAGVPQSPTVGTGNSVN